MNTENFYLSLLSNSSMDYYPENTTANFSTKLPKTIKLEGEWSVALVEIQYPCTLYTVQEFDNIIYMTIATKLENEEEDSLIHYKTHIPVTNYDNIEHIVKAANAIGLFKDRVMFVYDDMTSMISVQILDKEIITLKLSPKLGFQLGFEPNVNLVYNKRAKYPANLYLGLPSQLFIYCDIIAPQIVGDVMASLLRIIPLETYKYTYGSNKMHVFSPPYYLPIIRREFDTIEIDIRSSVGEKIPFQFGTSYVKLHFQRRY